MRNTPFQESLCIISVMVYLKIIVFNCWVFLREKKSWRLNPLNIQLNFISSIFKTLKKEGFIPWKTYLEWVYISYKSNNKVNQFSPQYVFKIIIVIHWGLIKTPLNLQDSSLKHGKPNSSNYESYKYWREVYVHQYWQEENHIQGLKIVTHVIKCLKLLFLNQAFYI